MQINTPKLVLDCIPYPRRNDLIEFGREYEAFTTRELAVNNTDEPWDFFFETAVYLIQKAADLITVPYYMVFKAAEEFAEKTTAINEMPLLGSCGS